jgi:hypothetical protein
MAYGSRKDLFVIWLAYRLQRRSYIGSGEDSMHTGRATRSIQVGAPEPRMRSRAAHKGEMQRIRQPNIVDIRGLAN